MSGTDCLVLLLEDSTIYMNLFIVYDGDKDMFFLSGKKMTERKSGFNADNDDEDENNDDENNGDNDDENNGDEATSESEYCEDNGWVPYSFYCKEEKILLDFIDTVMDTTVNIYLYNFNDLPFECKDISFDLLHNSRHERCEIVRYMEEDWSYDRLKSFLKILKNIHNN